MLMTMRIRYETVRQSWRCVLFLLATLLVSVTPGRAASAPETGVHAAEEGKPPEPGAAADSAAEPQFFDSEDGWLDVSDFLETAAGFVAAPIIITEPAIGYGGGLAALFVQPREKAEGQGFVRPDLTLAGGLATENGTWAVAAMDIRHWLDGRLKTDVGVMGGDIRLDFYGIGDPELDRRPLGYQLDTIGMRLGGRYRVGSTSLWLGGGYQFARVEAQFDGLAGRLEDLRREPRDGLSRLSGPLFTATWDSRDTVFTPRRGVYSETSLVTGFRALGGTTDYQVLEQILIGYYPISPRWTLGLRFDLRQSFGEPPFFAQPAVAMRGIQAQRYQGQRILQGEVEVRWQFWRRFSLVVFGGGGGAFAEFRGLARDRGVGAGGAGIRYELARRFGLHYGIDVAWGPDGGAFYIQLGSAWGRP